MKNVILIRFNEIHLKGGNKKYFIKLLYNNIKQALTEYDYKLENIQNRLIIRDYKDEDEIFVTKYEDYKSRYSVSKNKVQEQTIK